MKLKLDKSLTISDGEKSVNLPAGSYNWRDIFFLLGDAKLVEVIYTVTDYN